VALALAGATAATADNYGTTPAMQARMTRLIHRYFDPTGYGDTMVRCAARESGFNPRAVNWAGPVFGLLQIRYGVWSHPGESLMHFAYRMWNPYRNLELGVRILKRQGMAAWGYSC